jgi:protoporphyrinogen oxidase
MTKKNDFLIIGGGPSGLSLAYYLQGNTLVLEKEAAVGGLCRSIIRDKAVFDIGGHSFHTPHPEVFELIQNLHEGNLYFQKREARVYSHGKLLPYPFQKYYDQIPNSEVVRECDEGLRQALGNAAKAKTFEDYIIRKFGKGIAKHFMLPYNRKLWARDLRHMSCEWTSERVANVKGKEEQFKTSGGKRKPLQANTKVGYPLRGGFQEIFRSFESHLPAIELNCKVAEIDLKNRIVITSNGRQYRWNNIVSTIPLPILVRMIKGTPKDIVTMADGLDYMSLYVIFLLVGRQLETEIQRIYIADPTVPPHKIAFNHNSSEYLRQQPHHAIMAEVSMSPEKTVKLDDIVPLTVDFLIQRGILRSTSDIIWDGYKNVQYAYPVYTHQRSELVQGIKDWLAQFNIYTLGRFGDWEYINSDRCIKKGLSFAKELRKNYFI